MTKRGKAPAFQFYPKDWIADTTTLSLAAQGAYIRLLSFAWVGIPGCDVGELPNDDEKIARMLSVAIDEWLAIARDVRSLFVVDGDRMYHKRLRAERKKQKNRSEQAKKAAKTRYAKPASDNDVDATSSDSAYADRPADLCPSMKKKKKEKSIDLDSREGRAREGRDAGAETKTLDLAASSALSSIEALFDDADRRRDVAKLGDTSVPKDPVAISGEFYRLCAALGFDLPTIRRWEGRIPKMRLGAAVRELTNAIYTIDDREQAWRDLPDEAQKRLAISVFNDLAKQRR